jgi:hypothetical protein
MEVNPRKLLEVLPAITPIISLIRTRASKVPLTSSWTSSVFLVDTSMRILRAKMSDGLLRRLGLRAYFVSGDTSRFVSLALNQPSYVRSHSTSSSIPGFCTFYRRYRFPAIISMCHSRRLESLVLAHYWLWIRVVARHYLHRPPIESLAPPSPRAH